MESTSTLSNLISVLRWACRRGLRHGADAENPARLHRFFVGHVAQPEPAPQYHLAVLNDRQLRPDGLVRIDVALNDLAQLVERGRIDADGCGVGFWEFDARGEIVNAAVGGAKAMKRQVMRGQYTTAPSFSGPCIVGREHPGTNGAPGLGRWQ